MRIQDLSLATKLTAANIILLLPTILLGYFLVIEKDDLISFAQQETRGVHYLAALQKGFESVTTLDFDKSAAQASATLIADAEKQDGGALSITSKAQEIVPLLNAGKANDAAGKISDAIAVAADNSNITLDPDADSYFVGDMLVNQGEGILQKTSDLYVAAQNLKKEKNEDNLAAFAVARDGLNTSANNFANDLAKAIKGNADITLEGNIGTVGKNVTAKTSMLAAAAAANDYAAIISTAPEVSRSVAAVFPKLNDELERLLNARIHGFHMTIFNRLGICLFIAILGILAAFYVMRSISRPIGQICSAMDSVSAGKLDVSLSIEDRNDEVGSIAHSFGQLKLGLIRARELEATQRAEAEAKLRHGEKINALVLEFQSMIKGAVSSLAASATELQSNASSMSSVTQQTQQLSSSVASASQQASANVQAVAGATEEMSASSHEIGKQMDEATRLARSAVEEAGHTEGVVNGLDKAAQKIGDIMQLIQDIAEQTNLLALNATIEAARAGEAGKGFSVVASEVKSLANQTAKATEDISTQINNVQQATQSTVMAIKAIGKKIEQISQVSATIASAVQEQSAATGEISNNVQQAAQGTDEISRNIAGVAEAANQTREASSTVLTVADHLAKQAENLRAEVDKFITALNAA
jgi:methyl-accepting chemotaxis protein